MLYLPRAKSIIQLPWLWIPQTLRFAGGYPCCCKKKYNCSTCEYPLEIFVTLPGGWTDEDCNDCAEFSSGTFVVTHPDPSYVTHCSWRYLNEDFDAGQCGTGYAIKEIKVAGNRFGSPDSPPPWVVWVWAAYGNGAGNTTAEFQIAINACEDLNGLEVPLLVEGGSGPCLPGFSGPAVVWW